MHLRDWRLLAQPFYFLFKVKFKVVPIEQACWNDFPCVNTSVAKVSTAKFPTSIKSILFVQNRINSTCKLFLFDVHFNYIDNAFMCTAYQLPKMK